MEFLLYKEFGYLTRKLSTTNLGVENTIRIRMNEVETQIKVILSETKIGAIEQTRKSKLL